MSDARGLPLLSGPPPPHTGVTETSCRRCNKEFNLLFARSRKCNHCGYSYCSSCSDFQALMPRSIGSSGYETATVCAYCIEYLTITASGKANLKALPLAKLKKYADAYNIKLNGAIEKQDLVDTIVAARNRNGCLPFTNEEFYRRHSVPQRGSSANERPRNFFSRLVPDPPQRPAPPPRPQSSRPSFPRPDLDPDREPSSRPYPSQPSRPSFPRPDLDPNRGQSTSYSHNTQSQARPQTQYTPYTPSSSRGSSGPSHRSTSSQASPNLDVPPQHARMRTSSAPPWPAPPPTMPTPTLDELLLMGPDQLSTLSIGTLKTILLDNHVNARLILEKSDLVAKVNTLVQDEREERERKRIEEEEEEERQRRAQEEEESAERLRQDAAAERERQQVQMVPADTETNAENFVHVGNDDESRPIQDSNRTNSPLPPKTPPKAPMPPAERHGLCIICQDEEANIAIVDCGHLAMCRACSELVMNSTRECPLCRTRIVTSARLLRIYRT